MQDSAGGTKRKRSSGTQAKGSPKNAKKATPSKPKRNLRQEKLAKKEARRASLDHEERMKNAREVVKKALAKRPQVEDHSDSSELAQDPDDAADAAAARLEKKQHRARRRKKGKVFMEDKASLLNLLDDVTASKNAVISAKLDKERDRAAAAEALSAKREAGKKGRKADERAKAMDAAKEAILVREREKKDKRRRRKGGAGAGAAAVAADAAPKKRVGFA